ncbi:MAG: hypothetical protein M3Q44_08370 [bacterium]|nr:hypothetical protein [bacterium]
MKKYLLAPLLTITIFGFTVTAALAAPGAQVFNVFDNTYDGLQVGTDPTTGKVEANANPGGKNRLIINLHLQKAAPNCTLSVQLVRDSAATNGGLSTTGHTGSIQTLGTLTTNGAGNGNAHFDIEPSADGTPDTDIYGHLDFEDLSSTCTESDGTTVANNEYGAAPDPLANTPFTWKE